MMSIEESDIFKLKNMCFTTINKIDYLDEPYHDIGLRLLKELFKNALEECELRNENRE